MSSGIIVKALSGFFYVQDDQSQQIYQCKGRGILKKNLLTPLVGDHVRYTVTNPQEGVIEEIEPRKNEFFRPKVANVDQVVLVFTYKEPEWNQHLLDRFIAMAEYVGVQSVIVINKYDLLEAKTLPAVEESKKLYEQLGYPVIFVSTKDGVGKEALMAVLENKISMFSGQTGVGKSSILNFLEPSFSLKTGDISSKLGRGKHTTRHVELFPLANGGFLVDTPGFGQIDLSSMEDVALLAPCFVEIGSAGQECKYRGCTHTVEDGCHVRKLVNAGEIDQKRYQHYSELIGEIKEYKKNKY